MKNFIFTPLFAAILALLPTGAELVARPSAPASAKEAPAAEGRAAAADAATAKERPGRLTDRFAGASEIDFVERDIGQGRIQKVRLLPARAGASPVRVEEVWQTGQERRELVRQQAMVADRILVRIPSEADREALASVTRSRGYRAEKASSADLILVDLGEASIDAVPEALEILEDEGLSAEPDYLHFPAIEPSDPRLSQQWGLTRVEAAGAWDMHTGSREVVVAVLDSGIMMSHEDLAGNLWTNPAEIAGNGVDDDGNGRIDDVNGWDFAAGDNTPEDGHGHGTHVSGIIGALGNNETGIAGVNWNASLLPLRVGDGSFSTSDIVAALDYVLDLKVNRGINIVATNNSYGTTSSSLALKDAIARQRDAGILFVAAAGNDGADMDSSPPSYPAAYPHENIISVASSTSSDELSSFSNYSSQYVHLAAPGSSIYSTLAGGSYGNMSGTSMAAPMVAGAVALMAAASPDLSWIDLRQQLLDSTDVLPSLTGTSTTGGRLNLRRALGNSLAGTATVEIVSPGVPAIKLPGSSTELYLEAVLKQDQAATEPAGDISWEVVQGPAGVTFNPHSNGATAKFPSDGDYLIRAATPHGDRVLHSHIVLVQVGERELLPEGLLGFWKMDEGEGNSAADASGGTAGASLVGATWTEGRVNRALGLDGASARADFTSSPPETITISAWVRSDSAGNSIFPRIVNGPEHLLFFGRDETGWEDANRGTVKFFADRTGDDGVWYSPPGSIGDAEWVHVAATYDGSSANNRPEIYVNGERLPVLSQIDPSGDRPSVPGTSWSIGDDGQGTRAWDGAIDEVRVYQRALSHDEVRALSVEAIAAFVPALTLDVPATIEAGSPVELRLVSASGSTAAGTAWSQIAGPGSIAFAKDSAGGTTATFDQAGTYELQAESNDDSTRSFTRWTIEMGGSSSTGLQLVAERSDTLGSPEYPVNIRVVADSPAEQDLEISLTVGGDAISGEDYASFPNTVTIPKGEQEISFELVPLRNETGGEKTVRLEIASGDGSQTASVQETSIAIRPLSFKSWQGYHYGESDPATDPSTHKDGDGIPHLLKYALGVLPGTSSVRTDGALPQIGSANIGGGDYLTLTFRRPAGLRDVEYHVEASGDGRNWREISSDPARVEVTQQPDGVEEVTVRDDVFVEEARIRLLRLRVSLLST